MPGRNGMGPTRQGPRTGRGWGRSRDGDQLIDRPLRGQGFGMGRGGGGRHRHMYCAAGLAGWQRAEMGGARLGADLPSAPDEAQELRALKQQAESLDRALGALKSRIQDLDRTASDATGREPT